MKKIIILGIAIIATVYVAIILPFLIVDFILYHGQVMFKDDQDDHDIMLGVKY